MYDLCLGRKRTKFSRDPVIKSRPDGKQDITVCNSFICRKVSVHADVAKVERMVRWQHSASHNRRHHRYLQYFRKLCHLFVGSGNLCSSADQKQGFFRLVKSFHGSHHLSVMYFCVRFVSSDIYAVRILLTAEGAHHVFWQIDQHRPRFPGPCDIKGFFDNTSQICPVPYNDHKFGDISCHAHNINFLERIISDQRKRHLPGEAHKRYTVIIRRSDSRHQVCRPRPAGRKTDPHFTGRPCIPVCRMDQSLFVSRKDHVDRVIFV